MDNVGDLFTSRQLFALITISDCIEEAHQLLLRHSDNDLEYANAITSYLACALSRMTDYHNNLCTWNPTNENISHLFQRQAIPMAWDFCEANTIEGKLTFKVATEWIKSALNSLPQDAPPARVLQLDARKTAPDFLKPPIVSTDPPYYDNISYADLSDFFYVWLRRIMRKVDPQTFATMLTPKDPELIASPTRHGSEEKAQSHFRQGFQEVFQRIQDCEVLDTPCTIYYAFKQTEKKRSDSSGERASTGWETMLDGLVKAGFQITGTWPVRTTKKARSVARNANALASAIVLVVRKRSEDAPLATRKEFVRHLKESLPEALRAMTLANIAPVDLAQSAIGPGMAVFTQYSKVMEVDGSPMSVRVALDFINQTLDEALAEQETEFDADTRWAISWFEQMGMDEGLYGVAETLSKAKNTAVNGLVEAGILSAHAGKVRLLKRKELSEDWDPASDKRLTVWEATQYLIRALDQHGEQGAAELLQRLGGLGETSRDLAYRLYNICEHKKWAQEALAYNSLVIAWPEISRLAHAITAEAYGPQEGLFESE
jgi:putative DNA methylase